MDQGSAKSPKAGKKTMVKALEKQANGRYVSTQKQDTDTVASPRPKRSAGGKKSEDNSLHVPLQVKPHLSCSHKLFFIQHDSNSHSLSLTDPKESQC